MNKQKPPSSLLTTNFFTDRVYGIRLHRSTAIRNKTIAEQDGRARWRRPVDQSNLSAGSTRSMQQMLCCLGHEFGCSTIVSGDASS